ncbi:acyltransferase [Polaromonas sp. P1(28)-8]|nr:acyltransferase [Polaromonas sp. P1(28)-8]
MISGFVMAMSTRTPSSGSAARVAAAWIFMKRRLLRIAPLYWFYTLLKAALLLALPTLASRSSVESGHLAASLLFIPATSPWGFIQPTLPVGWTLNFEMLFYAVFALALALGAPRIRFCLLVFLAIFLAGSYIPGSVPLAFYANSIVFEFILGVCIAQVLLLGPTVAPAMGPFAMIAGAALMFAVGGDAPVDRLFTWGLGAALVVLRCGMAGTLDSTQPHGFAAVIPGRCLLFHLPFPHFCGPGGRAGTEVAGRGERSRHCAGSGPAGDRDRLLFLSVA